MPLVLGRLFKPKKTGSARENFDTLFDAATVAVAELNFERALQLYDAAIRIDPSNAEAYYKRGNMLKNLGRPDLAIESYDIAIARAPRHAYAYCNRGAVQHALGLKDEAMSSYAQAIACDATDATVHYNRALLLQDLSRWDEALDSYALAISIDPQFADAQYNYSLALLFAGDFRRGWRGYEWRWKVANRLYIGEPKISAQPLWLGDRPLSGKRLLLHSEGGLGDTLQFCRYASLAAELGAIVYLEVQAPLVRFLVNLDGVSNAIENGNPLPPYDYHCPLMSLPLAFGTSFPDVPAKRQYLPSNAGAKARWDAQLGGQGPPRIGLAWSGNPMHSNDQRRSLRLADWIAHLPRGFRYVCLQQQIRAADEETLLANPWISKMVGGHHDFSDTAALCECMDLVISVDTSLAHLSAGLGRPTWILLPLVPDWRWLLGRDYTPWYPTARLYRQKTLGDWNETLGRVEGDLRAAFDEADSV